MANWHVPDGGPYDDETIRDERGRLDLTNPFPPGPFAKRALEGRTIVSADMRRGGTLKLTLDDGNVYDISAYSSSPPVATLRIANAEDGRLP